MDEDCGHADGGEVGNGVSVVEEGFVGEESLYAPLENYEESELALESCIGEVRGRIETSPPMRRTEDDVSSENFDPARRLELCLYTCIYRPTFNSNGSTCFDILRDLHFVIPNHRWSTALSSLL